LTSVLEIARSTNLDSASGFRRVYTAVLQLAQAHLLWVLFAIRISEVQELEPAADTYSYKVLYWLFRIFAIYCRNIPLTQYSLTHFRSGQAGQR
jgi:hypothetical protein